MSRRRVPGLALAALLLAGLLPGMAPAVVRAAEYRMATQATYSVQPAAGEVAVSVEVTFENTTPDPEGQFSVFEAIDLAIQPGASEISAEDGEGRLTADTATREDHTLVRVRPRDPVRFRDEAAFTLRYTLADGSAPRTRVRASVVALEVWGFGTESEVAVTLPGSYEVAVDGDDLAAERTADGWRLASGAIEDPTRWLARVVATGPSSFVTVSRAVPLASGTVDLQVRAWADDAAWGERTLALLGDGLPALEAAIGLPYPEVGPLVVVESISGPDDALGEPTGEGRQLLAGYDEPPFTLLHQAAHVWLGERLAAERWIREGFSSFAAAEVAPDLAVEAPYDPAARREELAASEFPLVSWGSGEATDAQDAFAYAASWAVAAEVAAAVGRDELRLAWQRIAAGMNPYQPVTDGGEPPAPAVLEAPPVDARALLDHLEAVSGADVAAVFEAWVLDDASIADLAERVAARAAYDELLAAAGGWGPPEPVMTDLAAWRFAAARQRIDEARDWLSDRDALAADAERAGLTLPQRLRDRFRTAGGGPDARAELEAEAAVVAAYAAARERASADPGPLERLGLLGSPGPDALLTTAADDFARGELRGAAEGVEAATARLDRAATDGAVRLVALLLVGAALTWLALRLGRRGRAAGATDYTAGG